MVFWRGSAQQVCEEEADLGAGLVIMFWSGLVWNWLENE